MRVLVACEFSGIVRDAFLARGHDAMSCDLLPSERPGPHYQGNVLDLLGDGWDMMIAHPPCTYLTLACTWRWRTTQDEIREAANFFLKLWHCSIPHIAIENPPGWLNSHVLRPAQTVQPWWFGERYTKATSLWLKNLPPLTPTRVTPRSERNSKYIVNMAPSPERWKLRSKTPHGLAEAMADQWGGTLHV